MRRLGPDEPPRGFATGCKRLLAGVGYHIVRNASGPAATVAEGPIVVAGSGNPRPDTVRRLAGALGVDPAWLLFGDENPKAAA